ncbi:MULTISPECIES: hypothetical protein [Bacteroidaceae]|uniref:Uncharacterized protein n=1 Tax=Caecibacteroides pullorum TaxID=2725562 RepID=A0AA40ZU95_9BACT|nr:MULTISPECIES: hypothetical protein [Bacteroidaceae]MBM6857630.1 hypothetical protein [Caecibacteroides pullorum]MBV8058749.1 hypothetical protein [Caecibacteroides pullorum]
MSAKLLCNTGKNLERARQRKEKISRRPSKTERNRRTLRQKSVVLGRKIDMKNKISTEI